MRFLVCVYYVLMLIFVSIVFYGFSHQQLANSLLRRGNFDELQDGGDPLHIRTCKYLFCKK